MRTVYPLGTTIYRPEKCWNGYTVINSYERKDPWSRARIFQTTVDEDSQSSAEELARGSGEHLIDIIDMNGNVVHGWNTKAWRRPQLLDNGNIVMTSPDKPQRSGSELSSEAPNGSGNVQTFEFDWNGEIVWACASPVEVEGDHSGAQALRMTNGNTLFIYMMLMPDEYRERIKDPQRRKMEGILSGCIAEATPDKQIVWDWRGHDNLDLNGYCPNDPNPNWMHPNNIQPLPPNRHYDAGDERFKPGNILFSGRSLGCIFIIEKQTGEVVWRYRGQWMGGLAGQHSPQMIETGLPGQGNILVFDNGQSPLGHDRHGGMSAILEIDPALDKEVWVYENEYSFFSSYGGHCERLANGNTLIAEPYGCRVFEITLAGEIVWEYVRDPGRWLLTMDATRVPYDYCPQLRALHTPTQTPVIPPPHVNTNPKPIAPCPHHELADNA